MLSAESFKHNKNLSLLVYRNLNGPELFHKIALLNKKTRESLLHSGLLDQPKVLTMKSHPKMALTELKYAAELATALKFIEKKAEKLSINANSGERPLSMDPDFTWV